jgi:Xaa-Pro aminopeptidase
MNAAENLPSLAHDAERMQRARAALRESGCDAFLCSLPTNVLLLTGYWPVIGSSVALLTADRFIVICPQDEEQLAKDSRADQVITYQPASLNELSTAKTAIRAPLQKTLGELGRLKNVGMDSEEATEPAPYAALHLFGTSLAEMLSDALPNLKIFAIFEQLARLRSQLTQPEIERVRSACRIAGEAFMNASAQISFGINEAECEGIFRHWFSREKPSKEKPGQEKPSLGAVRQEAFVWCMSGENSAKAHAAYARTRARQLRPGDLVMMHCNSCVQGFWTDITRTFHLGDPDERVTKMYQAIAEAGRAAIAQIRPGARASEVDRAAREVLSTHGFGKEFKHQTGHGVGFAAISADARPRLHPKSPDILEAGMVFNVEPAIYIDGFGGIRQCDVVLVNESGAEVLTQFQRDWRELILERKAAA